MAPSMPHEVGPPSPRPVRCLALARQRREVPQPREGRQYLSTPTVKRLATLDTILNCRKAIWTQAQAGSLGAH